MDIMIVGARAALALQWPGATEILLILLALLLLFGGKKLPELARGLGRSLRVFKSEYRGLRNELEDQGDDMGAPPTSDQPTAGNEDDKRQGGDKAPSSRHQA